MNEDNFNGMSAEELYQKGKEYLNGDQLYFQKDNEQAVKCFQAAGEKGNLDAIDELIHLYKYEEMDKTTYWYRKAAETGDSCAMLKCGEWLLIDYDEIPKDKTEALKWLEKAAVLGEKEAMQYLAEINEYGFNNDAFNLEKNFEKAQYWYQQLFDHGEEVAAVYAKLMEKRKVDPSGKPLSWGGKNAFDRFLKEYYPQFDPADVIYSNDDGLLNTKFSESEIDEYLKADENIRLVCQIVLFYKTARKQGLLALEDEVENVQDVFLKTALRLTVDAIDPEETQKILRTITAAIKPSGSRLLSNLIIMQSIFCLQNGKNLMLEYKSLLGEKVVSILEKIFPDEEEDEDNEGPLLDTEVENSE